MALHRSWKQISKTRFQAVEIADKLRKYTHSFTFHLCWPYKRWERQHGLIFAARQFSSTLLTYANRRAGCVHLHAESRFRRTRGHFGTRAMPGGVARQKTSRTYTRSVKGAVGKMPRRAPSSLSKKRSENTPAGRSVHWRERSGQHLSPAEQWEAHTQYNNAHSHTRALPEEIPLLAPWNKNEYQQLMMMMTMVFISHSDGSPWRHAPHAWKFLPLEWRNTDFFRLGFSCGDHHRTQKQFCTEISNVEICGFKMLILLSWCAQVTKLFVNILTTREFTIYGLMVYWSRCLGGNFKIKSKLKEIKLLWCWNFWRLSEFRCEKFYFVVNIIQKSEKTGIRLVCFCFGQTAPPRKVEEFAKCHSFCCWSVRWGLAYRIQTIKRVVYRDFLAPRVAQPINYDQYKETRKRENKV